MAIYGYARVSAKDQNINRQIDAFIQFNIPRKNIFADKKSGKDFERKNYQRLIHKIKKGDLLVIKSIDRLGRNYDAIINEWNHITNCKGADILVLDMPLLDTRTKADNLVGKLISDLVLQILSFVAENERSCIRQRQAEGIKSAKLRGTKFGRPKRNYSEQQIVLFKQYNSKEISLKIAAEKLNMSPANFYYHAQKFKN